MIDIYQGDPKIYIDENGADFNYKGNGGQPEMEQGIENVALISLFTDEGWPGNFYLNTKNKKIGSSYYKDSLRPITLSNIDRLEKSTIIALNDPIFKNVVSNVTTQSSGQLKNIISVQPPQKTLTEIVLTKNGLNWVFQADKGNN